MCCVLCVLCCVCFCVLCVLCRMQSLVESMSRFLCTNSTGFRVHIHAENVPDSSNSLQDCRMNTEASDCQIQGACSSENSASTKKVWKSFNSIVHGVARRHKTQADKVPRFCSTGHWWILSWEKILMICNTTKLPCEKP